MARQITLTHQLLDRLLLLLGQLDAGPTLPTVNNHQPIPDGHGSMAIGTGAENALAVNPDFSHGRLDAIRIKRRTIRTLVGSPESKFLFGHCPQR